MREELATLHAHPDTSLHPSAFQVPELTIALRRISDKLTSTEDTLVVRTAELANALGDIARARYEVQGAYELTARTRAREEEHKVKERELLRRVRAAEEERAMTDRVVQEYADLVRTLEGRQSVSLPTQNGHFVGTTRLSNGATVNSLKDGKSGLQKLLQEFNAETERLESEIGRLHGELEEVEGKMHAEKESAKHDRTQLAQVRAELEKLKIDDNTAAKMVSRYM